MHLDNTSKKYSINFFQFARAAPHTIILCCNGRRKRRRRGLGERTCLNGCGISGRRCNLVATDPWACFEVLVLWLASLNPLQRSKVQSTPQQDLEKGTGGEQCDTAPNEIADRTTYTVSGHHPLAVYIHVYAISLFKHNSYAYFCLILGLALFSYVV